MRITALAALAGLKQGILLPQLLKLKLRHERGAGCLRAEGWLAHDKTRAFRTTLAATRPGATCHWRC